MPDAKDFPDIYEPSDIYGTLAGLTEALLQQLKASSDQSSVGQTDTVWSNEALSMMLYKAVKWIQHVARTSENGIQEVKSELTRETMERVSEVASVTLEVTAERAERVAEAKLQKAAAHRRRTKGSGFY